MTTSSKPASGSKSGNKPKKAASKAPARRTPAKSKAKPASVGNVPNYGVWPD